MHKTKDLFDRWAKKGDDKRAEKEHFFAVKHVLDSLKWNSSDSYLDIGCGNGYTLRYVAKFLREGHLTGLDFSESMIANAKRDSGFLINAKFINDDFTKWDPKESKFDKIFSMEAFYYFENVSAAIKKVFDMLRVGGTFACVVDYYSENEASAEWPLPGKCNVSMQRHSMDEWKHFFIAAGFEDVEQFQIKYPEQFAKERWQVDVGSLATIGNRAR